MVAQFEKENPGWKAELDDHGNIYHTPPPPPPPPRTSRLAAEAKVRDSQIDLVCVIHGHSSCSKEKIRLPPNVCAITLSLLGDSLITGNNTLIKEVKQLFEQSSSPSLPVSSFIYIAKKLRVTKLVYPKKVVEGSIRARCGSVNEKEQSTVSNQHFFGGTKTANFVEGIFMVEKKPRPLQIEDISSKLTPDGESLLTRSPHGNNPTLDGKNEYIYKKTTDLQKAIIAFESNPDKPLDSSVEYRDEYLNLYEQRRLFCISLNFGENFRSCVDSCRGMDVMDLQRYYDLIVKWEQKNRTCAHEYFTQDDPSKVRLGIEQFIIDNALTDVPKTREALLMLSEKRKLQREKFVDMIPGNRKYEFVADSDSQLVQSSYLAETCENMVQKLHRTFPERKILIFFEGCRGTYEKIDPYASDHGEDDDELYTQGEGGARRKNIKNTNQNKKKTYKKKTYNKKTYKKKTYKKKTYKKKTYKKKINSCKNKK